MQVLTSDQARGWIGAWMPVESLFGPTPPDMVLRRFDIPDYTAPVHTILRHAVSWLIVDRASIVVWVHEYGVWDCLEDWNLYYRWRRSTGDTSVIEVAEGHLFMAHEAPDAVSLLLMARVFGWGFRAVSRNCRRAVEIDHDGRGVIVAEHDADLASAPPEWR